MGIVHLISPYYTYDSSAGITVLINILHAGIFLYSFVHFTKSL